MAGSGSLACCFRGDGNIIRILIIHAHFNQTIGIGVIQKGGQV